MKIFVGLGNPEKKYDLTRHNIGFRFLDCLATKIGLSWKMDKKLKIEIAENSDLTLIKPLTYMNNSGEALRLFFSFYKLGDIKNSDNNFSEILTVIHDELDLNLGDYKVSIDSRSAGHNGVQSIIDNLKTKNFKRIRLGIKTEKLSFIPAEKFVLEKFNQEELDIIDKIINNLVDELVKSNI